MNNNLSAIKIPLTNWEYKNILQNNVQLKELQRIMNSWLNTGLDQYKPLLGGVPQLSSLNEDQVKKLQNDLFKFINETHMVHSENKWIVNDFFEKRKETERKLFELAAFLARPLSSHAQPQLINSRKAIGFSNGHTLRKSPRLANNLVVKSSYTATQLENLPLLIGRKFMKIIASGDNNKACRGYLEIITSTIEQKVGPENAKEVKQALSRNFRKLNGLNHRDFVKNLGNWTTLKRILVSGYHKVDLSEVFTECMVNLIKFSDFLKSLSDERGVSASLKMRLTDNEAKKNVSQWVVKKFAD